MTAMPAPSLAVPQDAAVAGSTVDDYLRREITGELARVTDNVKQMAVRLDESNREAAHWREQMNAEMTGWRKEVEVEIHAVLGNQKEQIKVLAEQIKVIAEQIKVIARRLDDYSNQRPIITQRGRGKKPREQREGPRPAQDTFATTDARPVVKDDTPSDTERGAVAALAEGLVAVSAITQGDLQELLNDLRIVNQRDLLVWVIMRNLAPSRPISEYQPYDDAIRRITQDRFALILPRAGEHISSTDHRALGHRYVERGALGTVAEVVRPGLQSGEGPTKATILPAEVWETR